MNICLTYVCLIYVYMIHRKYQAIFSEKKMRMLSVTNLRIKSQLAWIYPVLCWALVVFVNGVG